MNDHELAAQLAYQAGQLLLDVRGDISPIPDGELAPFDQKALGDEGDRLANDFLISRLKTDRPDDVILSEESLDPATRHNANRVWIIDPLDGTSSFSRGYPGFAVHVALWERGSHLPGSISAAAVSVPMFDITLSTADDPERMRGEFPDLSHVATVQSQHKADGIRIVTSPSRPPQQLAAVTSALSADFNQSVVVQRMGSVGAKTCFIILGHADIYINTVGFHEWDLAAPLGVAHHYGLSACLPSGESFELNQPRTELGGALISQPQFVDTILRSLA